MTLQLLQTILFWLFAIITGLCAVGVVVTQNIVRSAVFLLFALCGTAAVFFLLGADFVGATQLIVYVGGTLVLVVFGVMLTAQGPFVSMKTGVAEWSISTLVGLVFLGVLAGTIAFVNWPAMQPTPDATPANSMNSMLVGEALLGIDEATPEVAGRKQMSYLLPFEIVSVHLLVVLIGAAYLARAKRRRGAQT